jgi:acyl-CoA dehydrogenase
MGETRDPARETRALLREAAERLFEKHCGAETMRRADGGEFPQALWRALAEAGYTAALVPESAGGAGLETSDALSLLFSAGRHALPAPLAETMLAGWLLSSAGIAMPEGPLTVAPVREADALSAKRDGAGWRIEGTATRVPWARQCGAIAVLAESVGESVVALVSRADCAIKDGHNIAGEPRDELVFSGAKSLQAGRSPISAGELRAMGAVMRSAQMAGALQSVLEKSVQYASERVQFGRPIGRFQAIQQNLALLAGQAAAATAAAEAAIESAARDLSSMAIAAAKIRSGEAAGIGAAIAHQVHGAIGFTQEHRLHYSTRRLWSWRDEFGNEAYWARRLGGEVATAGADRLWQGITAAG